MTSPHHSHPSHPSHDSHGHDAHSGEHEHDHFHRNSRLLGWATLLTLSFMFVEAAGGLMAHSLALVADAGHMLTDAAALGLAWAATHLAQRKPDSKRSFGYHRAQVLATFVNGVGLLVVVGWIAIEAVRKLLEPVEVNATLMLTIAAIGALVNVVVFAMLRLGDHDDMNISGALLHVLGDLLGSIGAIVGALVIRSTGWLPIDPILSVLLCALIVRSAWSLVRRSTHILLEGAPDWLDVAQLRATLREHVPAIADVHHVHCWSLSPRETLLTLHATVTTLTDHNAILTASQQVLAEHYGITHATIQLEYGTCVDTDCH
jgi:cobalt-zinc-cadmium efflux system protein